MDVTSAHPTARRAPVLQSGFEFRLERPRNSGSPRSRARAAGGVPPYSYGYSGLPPGCSTADVPTLSCTPSQIGTYNASVLVRDDLGANRTQSVEVYVLLAISTGCPASASPSMLPALLLLAGIAIAVVVAAVVVVVLIRRRGRNEPPAQPPPGP